jgi:hypothetical protein
MSISVEARPEKRKEPSLSVRDTLLTGFNNARESIRSKFALRVVAGVAVGLLAVGVVEGCGASTSSGNGLVRADAVAGLGQPDDGKEIDIPTAQQAAETPPPPKTVGGAGGGDGMERGFVSNTPDKYKPALTAAAHKWQIPTNVLSAQFGLESAGWAEDVVTCRRSSPAGAKGIAQFMPPTAAGYHIDPCNPDQALDGGAHYDRDLLNSFHRLDFMLAGYNAGGGAVKRYGGIPPYAETQKYVQLIESRAKAVGSIDNIS